MLANKIPKLYAKLYAMKNQDQDKSTEPLFLCEGLKVHKTTYENAISHKFDNRRVTVGILEDGDFIYQFSIADPDPTPHVICERLKGKVSRTTIMTSREAAEIVMMSLAEQLGFTLCKKIGNNTIKVIEF